MLGTCSIAELESSGISYRSWFDTWSLEINTYKSRLKQLATKENLRTYWRKPASFNNKVINIQLLVQSGGETYC